MTSKTPPEIIEGEESNIDVFEEAVAKAERLGREARQAATASTKEALKKAPRKLTIGEGRDAVDMIPRSPQDPRWPIVQGGPTGAPVSEEVFLPMIQSYAQEAIVDVIVSGVLNSVEGNAPFPNSPWEIKGTRMEVALVREACHKVGRPGMGL